MKIKNLYLIKIAQLTKKNYVNLFEVEKSGRKISDEVFIAKKVNRNYEPKYKLIRNGQIINYNMHQCYEVGDLFASNAKALTFMLKDNIIKASKKDLLKLEKKINKEWLNKDE